MGKKIGRVLVWAGVIVLQLIMSQVVTFIFSLFFPSLENLSEENPALLTAILGLTFGLGIFWAGWLAISLHWLPLQPRYLLRLTGALTGAYLPLIAFLLIYRGFPIGSPVFWFSVLGGVLGFYVLGWNDRR